jgi:hypothetical protein
MYYYEDIDTSDIKNIKHLYELRHLSNIFGYQIVSKHLNVDSNKVLKLIDSDIHGKNFIIDILKSSNFNEKYNDLRKEDKLIKDKISEANYKNYLLVDNLEKFRTEGLGIGTNKIKRRLNKLSKDNKIAGIIRLVIEIEDVNILAKKYYGEYRDKKYGQKQMLLEKLINIYKESGYVFGYHDSDVKPAVCILFFELDDDFEQVSWHSTVGYNNIRKYDKDWDGKENSTYPKLLNYIEKKFPEIIY